MSGGTKMYTLKPIISLPSAINQPKTMYEMRNVHGEYRKSDHASHENKIVSDITEQVIKFLKNPLPEIVELEARQDRILTQLAELKEQVSTLCDVLKQSRQIKSSTICTSEEIVNIDVVINANPMRPPFSILALQRTWIDTNFTVSLYTHSSIKRLIPNFPLLEQQCNRTNAINISLIWKEVTDFEFFTSGLHAYPLLGEVNLLRYLSRLISSHNYEASACSTESGKTDAVLDLCHQFIYQESPKERQAILSTYSNKLGKEQWLLHKKEPSIADIALWSVIKQISSCKLPSNLVSWFERCDRVFLNK